ncbi:MAG TPA: TIGR01777 family oxidoreductase [Chthoniobacteraceae bacterium]|jgi:hypothetical protein
MTIGLTGVTGFLGQQLLDVAIRRGHQVIGFSRTPERKINGCDETRRFSLEEPPDVTGCDAIVHLAGEPIFGVWTPAKKRRIVESRVLGTRRIVEAINAASEPPEVLVSGSAIGIYGDAGETELTESAPRGEGFLPETTSAWEAEATNVQKARLVLLRTSIVLGKGAGALGVMAPAFRAGLGGRLGTGRQWMSWIHLRDWTKLALFAVENLDLQGPLNATAPWPVRNSEFTRHLAATLRRPAFLPVPAFALRLLGDFSHELLDSKRVVPAAATEHAFGFEFPELAPALKDLLG